MRTPPLVLALLLLFSAASACAQGAAPGAPEAHASLDGSRVSALADSVARAVASSDSASADSSLSAHASAEIERACRRMSPTRMLKVEGSFGTFVGHAGAVGPAGLSDLRSSRRHSSETPPALLTWDRISTVQVRGSMRTRGAFGGAVLLGGALGGVACGTVFIADHIGANVSASDYLGWTGAGIAVGGVVGAFFGAAVGAALPTWRTVYQRR